MARGTGSWAVYDDLKGLVKVRRIIVPAGFAALLSLLSPVYAEVYYRMLFERIVIAMETTADPLNVLAAFQEIAMRHPGDRYYAARSQLYAGICYRRMGSDQAARAFQKVLTNFPDQAGAVKIAEAELAALNRPRQPAPEKPREIPPFKVWEGQSVYGTAALSGDGRYLCYVDKQTGDLMLYETALRKTHRLVSASMSDAFDGVAENATFSPDSRQIAYGWQNGGGGCEICAIGTDGSGRRTLWRDENVIYARLAGWTADGRQILAILAKGDLTSEIVLVSASNGSVRLVKKLDSQWPDHARLSPDGRYLAYSLLRDVNSPERDIFLYEIEKDEAVALVVQPGDDLLLGWTPDSQRVLYSNRLEGTTTAWLLPVGQRESQSSARRIKSSIGQVNPVGLAENGRFYYEVETGRSAGSGAGHPHTEVRAMENFLPEERNVLAVPDDYPTIQEAVDNADPDATILVRKGEYPENIIVGKSLTLKGEDRKTAIISGRGNGAVVKIMAGQVIMSGFTVKNGDYGIEIGRDNSISQVTLKDMIVSLNKTGGIQSAQNGGFHLIEDCIISHNGRDYGIYVHQFSRSTIRNCEVFGNRQGIAVGWSWYAQIEGNRVYGNRESGLSIDSCYYTTVKRNLIYANQVAGMRVVYISRRNTITENIVFGNSSGLRIEADSNWASVGENVFYHNDFIGNEKHVEQRLNHQIWDSGFPSGGNYWSNYRGKDSDDDGIGDVPHELAGDAKDNFPLAKPWNRLQADVGVAPDGLSPERKERWVTVYIALPAGIPGDEIRPSTVLLNHTLSPEKGRLSLGDYNDDGIPDLMMRFSGEKVSRFLAADEKGELTISGRLKNSLPFEGTQMRKAHQ